MTKEQKKALARVFRRQAVLFAEMPILEALLDTYARTNTVPKDWKAMREKMRKDEQYTKILAEFEPTISALETSADDEDLIPLLLKMSKGSPVN